MTPLQIVNALRDPSCGLDANYQHLRHWTEGYIAAVVYRSDEECPYSPGSAREVSWTLGARTGLSHLSDGLDGLTACTVHDSIEFTPATRSPQEDLALRELFDSVTHIT